jgi:hypothetical protein
MGTVWDDVTLSPKSPVLDFTEDFSNNPNS